MTERPAQFTNGSGNSVAGSGGTATTHNYYGDSFAPQPTRPTCAIHLDPLPALFIGREEELEHLHAQLSREGGVAYIPGQPGRGKSTLANHYAHLHQDEYQTVHMLHCQSNYLEGIAAEFARQLGLKLEGDRDANLQQLRDYCASNRCLLLLDNVVGEKPAGMLLGGRSSVILTTWHTNLKFLRRYQAVRLRDFTEDQCFELFRAKLGATEVDRHLAECRLLFQRLQFHPKALEIAAGLIADDVRHTIASMAKNLPKDIPALFAEAIATLSPEAQSLLAAMAACAPEGFRLSLAAQVAGFDENAAFEALNQICSRSLADELDRDTHRYRLHSLVRDAAHSTEAHRARHAEAVRDQFERWEANRHRCTEDLADWRTAFAWAIVQPGDVAWIAANALAFAGYCLAKRVGRLSEAHEICTSMASLAEARADKPYLSPWLCNQALILDAWAKLEEAMALHKQDEAICGELGNQTGLQRSYGNQAIILQAWGRLDDAMALLKQQEALCNELDDKDGLANSYGSQALILKEWGKLDDAMTLIKHHEALCLKIGDKVGLQRSYASQALILTEWGKLDDAIILHKQEEVLCEEHEDKDGLARCYANQGLLARRRGDAATERKLLQQALPLFTEMGMPRERDLVQGWLDRANGRSGRDLVQGWIDRGKRPPSPGSS